MRPCPLILALFSILSFPFPSGAEDAKPGDTPAPKPLPAVSEAKPQPARFQATVFELRIPNDHLLQLDAAELATAGAAGIHMALQKLGPVRIVARVDQSVDLQTPSDMAVSAVVPLNTLTMVGNPPVDVATVDYFEAGVVFRAQGTRHNNDGQSLDLNLAVTIKLPYEVDPAAVNGKSTHPVAQRNLKQSYRGRATADNPIVLLSADGFAPEKDKNSVCYVTSAVLTPTD